MPPFPEALGSLLDAWAEFTAAGEDAENNTAAWDLTRAELEAPDGWHRLSTSLADRADPDTRPAHVVADTTLWWVEGRTWLGRVSIRHALNDRLREVGGHIGYAVRPSARRQGHATAILRASLPIAARLGIDPALVTCDAANVASRKTIEAGGGVLIDERRGRLRFEVPTRRMV